MAGGAKVKSAYSPMGPLSAKQINKQANRQTAAALAAARAPILGAQQLSDAQAAAQRASIQGFGTAAASLLGQAAPTVGAGYAQAAQEEQSLAGGMSGGAAGQIAADQAANAALVQKQAPGAAPQGNVNAQDVGGALYDLGAYIPGSNLAEQGAHAQAFAANEPAVQTAQTGQDINSQIAKQHLDDQQYVQKLLDIASTAPAVRNQIMQELQKNEMAKASYQLSAQTLGLHAADTQSLIQSRQSENSYRNAEVALRAEGLKLTQSRDALAVKKFEQQGGQIDSAASKAAGYLVTKSGHYLTGASGKKIPVAASGSDKGVGGTGYKEAVGAARTLMPTATLNKNYDPSLPPGTPGNGKYVAQQGQGDALGTTDNKGRAQTSGKFSSFREAQDYLAQRYGISKQASRRALVAAGWKPDGKRPKK